MIQATILALALAIAFLALHRWRLALLLTLPFGLLADLGRKATEGQPIYMSALVVLPVMACLVGARRTGVRPILAPFYGRASLLRVPLILYLLFVLFQCVNGALTSGSPIVGVIGLVAYSSPVIGLLLGYHYARTASSVGRFLRWYVGLVVVMAISIVLGQLGVEWSVLEPVGPGLVAYTPSGMALDLETGFFRAAEVAAWHTAVALCFLFLIVLGRKKVLAPVVLLPWLLPLLGGALILTGRRKGIVEVGLFLLVYLACLAYFRRGAVKTGFTLALVAVAGLAWFTLSTVGEALGILPYVERSLNIGSTDVERVHTHSISSLETVIRRNGYLGAGAGMGSQGAQYFGAGAATVGGAAEGGVAKIVAELGVPGLFLMIWLWVGSALVFWRATRASSRGSVVPAHFAYGFLGILFASALTFTIGHQIFGDPLVLVVIGLVAGFLLRMPSLADETRVAWAPRPALRSHPRDPTAFDRTRSPSR